MSDVNFKVNTSRALPSPVAQGLNAPTRATRYGELIAQPLDRHVLSDEGTYFVAHNATNDAATTLAGHPAPVLADADATMTKPFLHLRHGGGSTSLVRVYLKLIEIEVVTAGANGTAANYAWQLDTGASRISSGGTALTKVNPNMQSSAASVLDILGGDPISGVESANVRHGGHGVLRPTIEIAGDKKVFIFGERPTLGGDGAAAAKREQPVNMPPVILGPTDQFLLALYAPSQSVAGVYKVRIEWYER